MMYLILTLLLNQAAAIGCDDNNPCPWYTFADCCGGVCWAFSSVTQCDSLQCAACKVGAGAAIKAGGQAECDVVTAAACEAAGGGPEDPIADICAASVVTICTLVWNQGLNQPDAVCQAAGMCSAMEDDQAAVWNNDAEEMELALVNTEKNIKQLETLRGRLLKAQLAKKEECVWGPCETGDSCCLEGATCQSVYHGVNICLPKIDQE